MVISGTLLSAAGIVHQSCAMVLGHSDVNPALLNGINCEIICKQTEIILLQLMSNAVSQSY